jgi:hypothetical protein
MAIKAKFEKPEADSNPQPIRARRKLLDYEMRKVLQE